MSSSARSTAGTIPNVLKVGALLTIREKCNGRSSSTVVLEVPMVKRLAIRVVRVVTSYCENIVIVINNQIGS